MGTIHLIDVTNRDGVQTSRILLSKLCKTMLNMYLDEIGCYQTEMGFPTLKHEKHYINANLKLAKLGAFKSIHLEGWCRAVPEDVNKALENCPDLKHLNVSISTSDIMLSGKFQGKYNWEDILKSVQDTVKLAKQRGVETVGLNAEDASRTELPRLIEFAQAGKEAGADRIRYCDTLGADDPITIYGRARELASTVKIPIEAHCHNDLGMAEAVSVACAKGTVESGMDAYINTTVNGYGERAGNCDLVSTILALKYAHGFGEKVVLGEFINLTKSWKIGTYAAQAFRLPIPINQPGIGANAFAHESGIHADGALKNRRNYELYDPEDVGRGEPTLEETGRVITTGAYSGIKGMQYVYEKLGLSFQNEKEAREILELVQYANIHVQRPLVDDELKFIAKYPDIVRELMTVNP